jgi:hypothetical protein
LQIVAAGGAGGTSASYTFVTGQWYHVAASRDSSNNQRLFVNGALLATATSTNNYTQAGFNLGRSGAGTNYISAQVTDFRLINGTAVYTAAFTPPTAPLTAITNTSLLLNYTNAGIYDAAGQNNLTTVGSAQVSTTTSKWNTTSMKFNGTTDYLNFVANPALNFGTADNFTVEAWVYVGAFADSFILSGTGGGGFFGFNGTLAIGIGRAGTAWDYTATHGMSANTWYHVAVTRTSGSVRAYVNGNQVGTTQTGNVNAYNFSSPSAYVGSQGATYYFNGYIQDLRVTRLSRSSGTTITLPTAEFFTR